MDYDRKKQLFKSGLSFIIVFLFNIGSSKDIGTTHIKTDLTSSQPERDFAEKVNISVNENLINGDK